MVEKITKEINLHDLDKLSGAIYFIVGKGTEGGTNSYRFSIAGITHTNGSDPDWGNVNKIKALSGYSLGAIQVDLGQRGTLKVGTVSDLPLNEGEQSYVQAIVNEVSSYAKTLKPPVTLDTKQLCDDLLTHNTYKKDAHNNRVIDKKLNFIDDKSHVIFNNWAKLETSKQWIHQNIDLPQVHEITQKAMAVVNQDAISKRLTKEERFQAIAMLSKAENQLPSAFNALKKVLENGGDYVDLKKEVVHIAISNHSFYLLDIQKTADVADAYYHNFHKDNKIAEALDTAQSTVIKNDYNPVTEATDTNIKTALHIVGSYELNQAIERRYVNEYIDPKQNQGIPTEVMSQKEYVYIRQHDPLLSHLDPMNMTYNEDRLKNLIMSPAFAIQHEKKHEHDKAVMNTTDLIRPITVLGANYTHSEIAKEVQTICYANYLHNRPNMAQHTLDEADKNAKEAMNQLNNSKNIDAILLNKNHHNLVYQQESKIIIEQTLKSVHEMMKEYKQSPNATLDFSVFQETTKTANIDVKTSEANAHTMTSHAIQSLDSTAVSENKKSTIDPNSIDSVFDALCNAIQNKDNPMIDQLLAEHRQTQSWQDLVAQGQALNETKAQEQLAEKVQSQGAGYFRT